MWINRLILSLVCHVLLRSIFASQWQRFMRFLIVYNSAFAKFSKTLINVTSNPFPYNWHSQSLLTRGRHLLIHLCFFPAVYSYDFISWSILEYENHAPNKIFQLIALSLIETGRNEAMTLDTHRTYAGCLH